MNEVLYRFFLKDKLNFEKDDKGNYLMSIVAILKPYPYDERYYYMPRFEYDYDKATRVMIKQKYDFDREINRLANKYTEPEEWEEYRAYVESCKEEAKLFANIKESWYN